MDDFRQALVAHYTDPIAPPTHKDVLLKTWAHDTEAMQCAFVHKDMSGGYWYMTKNKHGMFCWMWTLDHSEAMEKQAEFLNSAAGKEKP